MKLRLISNALLLSALPWAAQAAGPLSLGKQDFRTAQVIRHHEEALVSGKLSRSGRAKIRELNRSSVGKEVHLEIAGIISDFKLREAIRGDGLEMGPYTNEEAIKIAEAINGK